MIIYLFLSILITILNSLFSLFPDVALPDGVHNVLSLAVGYWNGFLTIFPFAVLPWHLFLYVVIPFEIALLVLKFFLGSRVPSHHIN